VFRLTADGIESRLKQRMAFIQTLAVDLTAKKTGVRKQQRTE
jgi:hypothetical protein